jgi:hypothetical protein
MARKYYQEHQLYLPVLVSNLFVEKEEVKSQPHLELRKTLWVGKNSAARQTMGQKIQGQDFVKSVFKQE